MSIMEAFMDMAVGRYIWIDIPSCEIPLVGKVEAFDESHAMMSNENGIFVVCFEDIAQVHLWHQAEIIS